MSYLRRLENYQVCTKRRIEDQCVCDKTLYKADSSNINQLMCEELANKALYLFAAEIQLALNLKTQTHSAIKVATIDLNKRIACLDHPR